MGNFTITPGEVMAALVGGAALATTIWHAAMYVGKLTVKVDRHEDRLNDHDDRFDRLTGHIR